ncbi:sulfotransferase family protein [Actinoallomurus sp. CA-150999]|uniref:sulfotransferase family protein n=1 Tax=Actinoallomurus sp. CA-150999 TaxID=3239887 RepID=UPI003D924339
MVRVVCTGLGRTGTNSIKAALERLGYGPCLHAVDLFANPRLIRPLLGAIESGSADWDEVLAGYESFVGGPVSTRWRELAEYYPEAKVIHTIRDPERWLGSIQETLFRRRQRMSSLPGRTAVLLSSMLGTDYAPMVKLLQTTLESQTFKSPAEQTRERAIELFKAHTNEVVETIPASRLLIFDVKSGWEPLCKFLDVPMPAEPFPRMNDRAEYAKSGLGTAVPLLLRRTR